MRSFMDAVSVVDFPNARYFAEDLFRESFNSDFPTPPMLSTSAGVQEAARTWHQYVAFYKWSETHIEPVGFCNWIRHDDVYLEGGMCVRRNFYRRLPKDQWAQCKQLGGIAQIVMETAATELNDAQAWFGYCGDKKAFIVDSRVGYVPTRHSFLIVKWYRDLSMSQKQALEDKIAVLGPF